MTRRLGRDDYTVGWVCALPIELAASQEMLDDEHEDLAQDSNDANIYTLGSIGEHNVVIACLPAGQTGTNSAAAVAMQMKSAFRSIRFGLMVGIGGGVPGAGADVRLGDVVVSQPGKGYGGVIQYDFGKSTPSGFERSGFLNTPPPILLAALAKLRANLDRGKSSLSVHISKVGRLPKFSRAYAGDDVLFDAGYDHVGGSSCASCDNTQKLQREARAVDTPEVHYGTIASANQVMRVAATRDQISSEFGEVLCFEMEAAGLMNSFPCLVIRGICDYADSHKNKRWQPYAAGTAAACAKELLRVIPVMDVLRTQTADEMTRDRTPIFYLPFLRNRQFVGRRAELDVLKQKLLVDKDCQTMAISGLGGVGKTQVALQFACSVKEEHPDLSIFWVQASSMETFERSCMEVATALGILQESKDDAKRLVQRWLCGKKAGRWLLIVDNADDLDLLRGSEQTKGLLTFLPKSEDGLTIFTTRHGEVAQSLAGNDVVEIGKMTTQEAVDLVRKSLLRKNPLDNDEIVTDLLHELDYLPLAITQAVAYINTRKSRISDYLRLLKNADEDTVIILSRDFDDRTRYPNSANAVAKTWTITFNKILEYDKPAADLLGFISCIEWKAIPYSMLPAHHSQARLEEAIGTLCAYSFLERRGDGDKFDMHRLVHLATGIWIGQKGAAATTSAAALKHLLEVFPADVWENRDIWRDYLPHAARIDKNEQCQGTEEKSELCFGVGRCLFIDGRIKEAVRWLRESCEWRDINLAEDHSLRLASQHALAIAYRENGQVKDAIELLERIVAIQAKVLAEDHPNRLASQHQLAIAYHKNRQVKDAVELLERVVAIRTEVLAEDHPSRLVSQHVLAVAYQETGQVKDAVELLERIVAIQAKVLAEDHPSQLASQHQLAIAYHENGQVKNVVGLLERAVAIEAKVLVEDHPSRLTSQYNLAIAYWRNGRVRDAVELLERVVAIRAKVLAEDHPDRLGSESALASFYNDLSDKSETGQILESSTNGSDTEDEDGRRFDRASEVPRATPYNSSASVAVSDQSAADQGQEPKSSNSSKRRLLKWEAGKRHFQEG
ncbi:kinesin light chain [Diplodia corticola]|uniref:Kinesin light chain n=1 Tax=Diplodia corticola TaxID=236234 RepID=A0A1J9RQP2_9PEZI|nr:kinesin light chain [Diplodia corticola]OJD29869.1 kinesin light chain [Diplodia corticola]